MDGTNVTDSQPPLPESQSGHAERLSNQANSLGAKSDRGTASTAGTVLPDTHIAGADSAQAAKPGWLRRQFGGVAEVAGAIGSGVVGKIEKGYDAAKGGVLAVAHGAESLYEHPEQISAAGERAVTAVKSGASEAAAATSAYTAHMIADPSGTLADTSHALASAATATGDALATAGKYTVHAGAAAASWVGDHKLETTAMVAAAAVEVFSVGTATPVIAAIAGAGGALAVHSAYSVADHLNEHSDQLSVLWNSGEHSAAAVAAARQTVAGDTGSAVLGLAASITGIGAARFLAGRAVQGTEDAVEGAGARTLGAASSGASQATDAQVPSPPPAHAPVHGDHGPNGKPGSHGSDGSAGDASRPAADMPKQPGADASKPPAEDVHEQDVIAARAADHAELNDNTGRPLTDRNAERVAEQHPPLSAEELAAQRAAAEKDLSRYKAADGKSILDQLNSSDLSAAQRERVLDVLAETRHSYMRAGADGQVPAEQLGSYRHTLGELKEGLDSAKANGLSPRETQDALLAGMLSDSHKYGWSAAQGGNFFSHHLDGALAADAILSRRIGAGFDSKDLAAVRHAILEHQISPPQFMGQAYANELRAGMARAGVTPSAADTASIANIQRLISDPLHAPVEADSQGGYRVAFSHEERELLRRYVGEGTQNWHVPAPAASAAGSAEAAVGAGSGVPIGTATATIARTGADTASGGSIAAGGAATAAGDALDPAKVSAVVRSADIFDNYSPEMGADGQAIKGPFKIAALIGPVGNPQTFTLDAQIEALKHNMRESEALLTNADKARAAARATQEDAVYSQARISTGNWLRQRGITPDADTPYWGKPLEAPPAGATPEQIQAWRQRPDVKLGIEIQLHFAQELHDMRLIGS